MPGLIFEVGAQRYMIKQADKYNLMLTRWGLTEKKDGGTVLEWKFEGYYGPRGIQRRVHELVVNDTSLDGDLVGYFKQIDKRLEVIELMVESYFEEDEMGGLEETVHDMHSASEKIEAHLERINERINRLIDILESWKELEHGQKTIETSEGRGEAEPGGGDQAERDL